MFKYSKNNQQLSKLEEISFSFELLKEADIEEWLKNSPEIIGEDIKIISQQFDRFDLTSERADLVAIDGEGDIVIIELKRDDSGKDVHWQAIKYASYFSKATIDDLAIIYSEYQRSKYNKEISITDAKKELRTHVYKNEKYEEDGEIRLNQNQKIVLISHTFSKEVLSAVMWLRRKSSFNDEAKIDIKCIQIKPYKQDNDIIISVNTIIPPQEIAEISLATDTFLNQNNSDAIDDRINTFRKTVVSQLPQYHWKMPVGKPYFNFYIESNLWINCYVRRQKLDIRVEIITHDVSQHKAIETFHSKSTKFGLDGLQMEKGSRNADWKRVYKTIKIESLDDLSNDKIISEAKQTIIAFDKVVKE